MDIIIFARLQQAKNIAGAGPVCSLTVNGPVAALVAETDYTFFMFGGGAVIVVMAITIVSMVACRWVRFQTKHPTQSDAIFYRRHSAAKFGTTVITTVRHNEEQPSNKGYYKSQRLKILSYKYRNMNHKQIWRLQIPKIWKTGKKF